MRFVRLGVLAVMVAGLVACGGGDDADVTSDDAAATSTTATTEPEVDVPQFIGDFDRVCTTQVGFKGTAAYEGGPGVHPAVFFTDHRGEGFVASAQTLPAGWKVEQDADFEDNSELQKAQLVACLDRVEEIPTGVMCDFEDDGEQIKLELVDANFDLKVYAAATGGLKHEQRIEARNRECPFIATFEKGDTTYVNEPTDDQLINALKPVVTPA